MDTNKNNYEDVEKATQNKKFFEPVTTMPPESTESNKLLTMFRASPILAAGFTGALLWGVFKWRGRFKRVADYPIDVYILDMRVQVVGIIVGTLALASSFDLALFKLEKKKFKKQIVARTTEVERLVNSGLEYQVKDLPPVYNPFGTNERPTYTYRIAKLMNWK